MDRDLVVGSSVAAAVVAIALLLIIFIFVRRQWSHAEERKLRIRAQLSGLTYGDDEVFLNVADPPFSTFSLLWVDPLTGGSAEARSSNRMEGVERLWLFSSVSAPVWKSETKFGTFEASQNTLGETAMQYLYLILVFNQ